MKNINIDFLSFFITLLVRNIDLLLKNLVIIVFILKYLIY
jgi:hypothetical protein